MMNATKQKKIYGMHPKQPAQQLEKVPAAVAAKKLAHIQAKKDKREADKAKRDRIREERSNHRHTASNEWATFKGTVEGVAAKLGGLHEVAIKLGINVRTLRLRIKKIQNFRYEYLLSAQAVQNQLS